MMFRSDNPWVANVIRLPKVTPKDDAQAQWSHTLPQDFAETIPMAICLREDESANRRATGEEVIDSSPDADALSGLRLQRTT